MKKSTIISLILLLLAIAALAISAEANNRYNDPTNNAVVYLLLPDNSIRVKSNLDIDTSDEVDNDPQWCGFNRRFTIKGLNAETVIGIDFRPVDGKLYGITDKGNLYLIGRNGRTSLVSNLSPVFNGGVQSLMDFNPVVDAIRLIGSNDQNLAIVKNQLGVLSVTAQQTAITYAPGDVNQLVDPNLVGGAYTNNVNGATTTLFYGLDFATDSFVTILPGANGSSATGGGQLTTIGRLVDASGNVLNISPTADLDILTLNGKDYLVGISGNTLFSVDLANIVIRRDVQYTTIASLRSRSFLDVAIKKVN